MSAAQVQHSRTTCALPAIRQLPVGALRIAMPRHEPWVGISPERFQPGMGAFQSAAGFLASGETVDGVVREARALCRTFGRTPREIGWYLHELTTAAECSYSTGFPRIRRPVGKFEFELSLRATIGHFQCYARGWPRGQLCPFGPPTRTGDCHCPYPQSPGALPGSYAMMDWRIVNRRTHEELGFSGLHPHLLYYHDFPEGQTAYHLDLRQAIRVLYGV